MALTKNIVIAGMALLASAAMASRAGAVTYTTSNVNFNAGFGQQINAPLAGSDTGCDSDAGVAACGDLLKVTGVSGTFTGGPTPNGTNYLFNNFTFHVEDTNGGVSGDYGAGGKAAAGSATGAVLAGNAACPTDAFCETIQIGNGTSGKFVFVIPYTINFGFFGDTFGFDPNVVLGTLKFQGTTYTVTSLGTATLGNAAGDDDKSYSSSLTLNFTDPAPNDPVPTPEPSSLALLGIAGAAIAARRRNR